MWAYDQPGDRVYVERLRDIFESHGGRVIYPELWADLEIRLERNESGSRLAAKPVKRDLAASRRHLLRVEDEHRLSSAGDFPFSPHLLIDNSALTPTEAAEQIVEHFELQRVAADA